MLYLVPKPWIEHGRVRAGPVKCATWLSMYRERTTEVRGRTSVNAVVYVVPRYGEMGAVRAVTVYKCP